MDPPEDADPNPAANELGIPDQFFDLEKFKLSYKNQLLIMKSKLLSIQTPISDADLQKVNIMDTCLATLHNQLDERDICL